MTASWASTAFLESRLSSGDGMCDGWAMSTLSWGAKRSISKRQLSTIEAGTTRRSVPGSLLPRLKDNRPST